MSALLTNFVADPKVFGDQLAQIAEERMPRATRADVARSHRAMFAPSEEELPLNAASVATSDKPVLVVHGDTNRLIPVEASRWYADTLPNARLEVLEKAGHWLQLEHPEVFAGLLREFLV